MEHPRPQVLPNSEIRYTTALIRYQVDCIGRRFRTVAAAFQFNGQPVHQENPAPESVRWESAVPETMGEQILGAACAVG